MRSRRLDGVPQPGEAAGIAAELRAEWGVPPAARLEVDEVCKELGIEVVEQRLGGRRRGTQALLIPRSSGFSIEVDPEPPGGWLHVEPELRRALRSHRRRFLICHELAHTLFYEFGERGPRRIVRDSPLQELFCDELARNLLVPADLPRSLPFSPDTVVQLQSHFDVSMQVAVRSAVASRSGRGVAWLLLRKQGRTLIQWTSANRVRTAEALTALQRLVDRAAHCRDGMARSSCASLLADGLFLEERQQAIVTCAA
jgi:hypothetical protein